MGAACFDRWDLSLDEMYTPYVFPSENGLRCGTRELHTRAPVAWGLPVQHQPLLASSN
ncbi:beta-galactosidase small subunit-related protein [Citrobacter freundii]|uniref:hypothetical protein n=1 Tax=Citrobacter freundii TaxID=546 RepID=UPI00389104EE